MQLGQLPSSFTYADLESFKLSFPSLFYLFNKREYTYIIDKFQTQAAHRFQPIANTTMLLWSSQGPAAFVLPSTKIPPGIVGLTNWPKKWEILT